MGGARGAVVEKVRVVVRAHGDGGEAVLGVAAVGENGLFAEAKHVAWVAVGGRVAARRNHGRLGAAAPVVVP